MANNSVTVPSLSSPHFIPSAHPSAGTGYKGSELAPTLAGSAVSLVQAHISCTPQIVENPILALGVDTLHQSLRLVVPVALRTKLEEAKKECQATSENQQSFKFGETQLFSWSLHRSGRRNFPYLLTTGDVTLLLSNRNSESPFVNASLEIGSISCNNGIDSLLKSLKLWFNHNGIIIKQGQVSRADLFVDVEEDIKNTGIEKQNHHITRATTCAFHYEHRKLTGIQIGKSDIVLRIYDKPQEMKTKRATEKQAFFGKLWGRTPKAVTRVEFQLRREAIKELIEGPTDWDSVKRALPGVFGYLISWFRHTESCVDHLRENNNQHLAESSPFWKLVENALEDWRTKFGKVLEIVRTRTQRFVNIEPLMEQVGGCMLTVLAGLGIAHDDVFEIMVTVAQKTQNIVTKLMDDPGYKKKFYARAARAELTF